MDGKKPMSFRVFKKYKSSSDQAYLLICFVSRYKKSILSSSDLKSLPYNHRAHPTQPITFLSQMKDMAKISLFYSNTMALIFPRLKDIANFVYTPLVTVNKAKFLLFWSQMKDMTKEIRLLYSCPMALILP